MFPKESLLIAFVAVVVLYFIAKFLTERAMNSKSNATNDSSSENKQPAMPQHNADDCAEGGCGMRAICNGKEEVVFDYYEDEELDRFKNRPANDYTEAEAAEFREVLTTLQGAEVAPWLNSLCARGVNLPNQLRAEAISLAKQNREG